jgi:peptidoglycan/xylan/chitin deacetylase (PgdA/CDA1 family)
VSSPPVRERPGARESRAFGLMYHGIHDSSNAGPLDRRSYDVPVRALREQLDAIAASVKMEPSTNLGSSLETTAWAITFDDGVESVLQAAELLEAYDWRAYFFVVSSWIGERGFLTRSQISRLRDRGHVIGSHSFSHPDPMSGLSYANMVQEWRASLDAIGSALGERVTTAAIPGGGYSSEVVAAAAEAGIDVLFTSEPVLRARNVHGCTVIGRYVIRNSTRATTAAALATGRPGARGAQWLDWNSKKLAKKMLGSSYYSIRTRILDRSKTEQS